MAPEMSYEPKSYNDKSTLTDGWHPAFLIAITDEATPETWQMFAQSPRMWRWHFATWQNPDAITAHQEPEHQSAPSSQKFTPKGRQAASKAYLWTCELLQRQIAAGERVNLDPLLPLPCRIKVTRKDDYANVVDLEKWLDGAQYLTPSLRAHLLQMLEQPDRPAAAPSTSSPAHTPQAAAYVAPQPGMQSWQRPAPPAQPATPTKASW